MKLEDLPKKQVFNIPDGYFDALPEKIQSRISAQKSEVKLNFFLQYRLQYILPVVVVLMVAVAWFSSTPKANDVSTMLASVETQDMISFLTDSDLTTDDLLDDGSFDTDDADEIETEVYNLHLGDDGLDELLEEIEIENI